LAGSDSLARAAITMKDGSVIVGDAGSLIEGDFGNRVPRDQVVEKFHFLTDGIIGEKRASEIVSAVGMLEEFSDMRDMTSLLAV
jgi:hypothetical protein